MQLPAGEIVKPDIEVIDPERAAELGDFLLDVLTTASEAERLGLHEKYRVAITAEPHPAPIWLGSEPAEILNDISNAYEDILAVNHVGFSRMDHWLIFGTYGAHIPWHTDRAGDMRFMLNVGREDASVDIAQLWVPEHYEGGMLTDTEPKAHERLTITPGEMYASNALASNENLLRPHQTEQSPSRLVLRTSVYAEEGWEKHADDSGGVTIELDTAA